MLFAGGLTDRFRMRSLGASVLLGLALTCLAMAVLPSVWLLAPVIFFMRFFGQGMATHTAMVAMARWFVGGRGRALAVAALGWTLGEITIPLAFAASLTVINWRWLWVGAAVVILIMLPVLRWLLVQERTPQSMAENTQSHGMGGLHWTRGMALRHPLFWLILPVVIGPPTFVTALFFQQVHFAEIKTLSHVALVALFPAYSLVGVVGLFGSGWVIDRWGTGRMLPFCLLPLAAGFVVLCFAQGLAQLAVGLALMGLTQGMFGTITSAFWAEFYGTRHLGSIRSMAGAIMVAGSSIGPGISGAMIDAGIGFDRQMLGFAGWLVLSSISAWVGTRVIARA